MYGSGTLDTADVLLNRGLNGFGYGYGGALPIAANGNFLGDGSATNANTLGNRDLLQTEAINRTTSDRFLSNQIDRGNNFLTDRINQQFINERFSTIERQMLANQNDTQRDIANVNLKLTECCCKLEAGQAAILAKLDAQALAQAQQDNINLRNQITIMQAQSQGN